MSEKKKFTIEYEIKSSPRILYGFLSEANGLTQWFADDVTVRDQVYTFTWSGLNGWKMNPNVFLKWKYCRMS